MGTRCADCKCTPGNTSAGELEAAPPEQAAPCTGVDYTALDAAHPENTDPE